MSEYKLTFSNSAFNAGDISGITKTWKNYTHTIKNANETVRSLDRYDDFATMKLNVGQYRAESPDSKYGIPFDRNIHSDSGSVITEHQYDAAHAFLQKLRGFGLLADVVGSGKTFEACTVLSELAARGAISTMLLIVPRQVLNEWIHILENRFGLGEGALFKYPDLSKNDKENEVALKELDSLLVTRDGILCPTRPVIVAMEDFLKWNDDMTKCLFDVVVVDEAHHLCDRNKDEYSGAMYKLSLLMETKRKHNKPYCLLLSATPHSGDLEKMFRLWYFIRCKGGDPKDFKGDDVNTDDSTGKHTAKYEKELACYRNEICRGAKTVFDFINKTKISEMLAENSPYRQDLINFYNAKKIEAREAATQDFSQLTEMQKVDLINDYLEEKHEVRDAVLKNVANSYHNGVMRSIMIRSAKSASSRLNGRTKCARNILFFPSSVLDGLIEVEVRGNEKISVDMEKLGDINGEFVIHDGNRISLNEYVTEMGGNLTIQARKATIYNTLLHDKLSINDESFKVNDINRYGAYNYFYTQLRSMPRDVETIFSPVAQCDFKTIFDSKIKYLKEILRTHSSSRVLIFLDYELRGKNRVADAVEEALLTDESLSSRLLCATKANKLSINAEFNEKENAILLAKDSSVTEGTNLQASNIVINFQVTPDPVAMEQRIGRVFRMGQKNNVIIYSLADMTALEGYVLMYFARIGLLSSNSGDATIIAGSNNNHMMTIRCKCCKNTMLISREEYDTAVHSENSLIYCDKTPMCRDPYLAPNGTLMTEISTIDFQCSNPECSMVFERSELGYECLSSDRSVMCNSAKDRNIYCHKMCAISHCRKFMPGGEYEDCPALKLYKTSGGGADDADLAMCCETCTNRCPSRCRFFDGTNVGEAAISRCTDCPDATCYPTPHVLRFDSNWEAPCPVCEGSGRLRPIIARTFPTYIRSLWDFKFDPTAFCKNLRNEANRVASISDILEKDEQYDN